MATRAPALPPEERRAAIIAATMPLVLERGPNVSTRQIAEAAGIAEGTIFGVFPDKEAVLQAARDAALDPQPAERALAAIDRSLPFEGKLTEAVRILQDRSRTIWRLFASIGGPASPPAAPTDFHGLLALLEAESGRLSVEPLAAARQLRGITMALSNPSFVAGEPIAPEEIVRLFLHGVLAREGAAK